MKHGIFVCLYVIKMNAIMKCLLHAHLCFIPIFFVSLVDKPYYAGHYVQSNAMLKVKVELAHPLTTPTEVAAKQPLTTTPQVYQQQACTNILLNMSLR